MFKKGNENLVFNSNASKHLGKLKLSWMKPYILNEEVAPGAFKLKNLDDSINANTINGHRLRP